MKKDIKVEVDCCDECKRHDMELKTCIGCGITLCSFCSSEKFEKGVNETNKYKCYSDGYRRFTGFKYDFDIKEMFFCLDCLKAPDKHKIRNLLNMCIEKEHLISEYEKLELKYEKNLENIIDRIYDSIYKATQRLREKGIKLIKPEKL